MLCLGEQFENKTKTILQNFMQKNYPQLHLTKPKNVDEARKQFSRQINLILVDESFVKGDDLMNMIVEFKKKKHEEAIPILFLTRDANRLIEAYHKYLIVYQELDDYCDLRQMEATQLLGKVKTALEAKTKRRSRRQVLNSPIRFQLIRENQERQGKFVDISLHGASLESVDRSVQFRAGDQLRVIIPYPFKGNEFLMLSAKVRRTMIIGHTAGVSFEYMSEDKLVALSELLVGLIRQHG